jgi:hypothetical protein
MPMRSNELKALAAELSGEHPGRVAVTITLPTRPDGLDRGEATRLRNLVRGAAGAVPKLGLERDVADGLTARLAGLEEHVDRMDGRRGHGVACYVTAETTRVIRLGHTPPERVLVGDTFSLAVPIADLLAADDVDVLVLSIGGGAGDGARHYRLSEGELVEQVGDGLPAEWDVRDIGERYLEEPKDSDWRDARVDDFLRQVDRTLVERFGADHDRQLVVVGTARLRTHWYSVATPANLRAVVAHVDGNVDHVRTSVLRDRVVAAVRGEREAAGRRAVAELRELDPARTAVGVDDVVTLARAGRLHRLLVEEGATAEVEVDGVVIGDRIANAVRAAFDAGTEIHFVPRGTLGSEQGIAGVVRW